jgi:hypothetical protein
MNSYTRLSSAEKQAKTIESKRTLLAYIRSKGRDLTMESYICLTRILSAAGWRYEEELWFKDNHRLATMDAAIAELENQITNERDHLLRQTVGHYR